MLQCDITNYQFHVCENIPYCCSTNPTRKSLRVQFRRGCSQNHCFAEVQYSCDCELYPTANLGSKRTLNERRCSKWKMNELPIQHLFQSNKKIICAKTYLTNYERDLLRHVSEKHNAKHTRNGSSYSKFVVVVHHPKSNAAMLTFPKQLTHPFKHRRSKTRK